MAAYTDLYCASPETAAAVEAYLKEQITEEEEPPNISAYVHKSTLRVTYNDRTFSREWDMQLMGFRDGYEAALKTIRTIKGN